MAEIERGIKIKQPHLGKEVNKMFDVERLKVESGLDPRKLALLEKKVREEFKADEMMFELHYIRVLRALQEGWINLEEALSESIRV